MEHSKTTSALIVEDQLFIVLELEEVLALAGFANVQAFSSASAASNWLTSNKPDIAIIDFRLRDGTSEELAKLLVNMAVPAFIYSGTEYAPEEDQPLVAKFEWISKPASTETLLGAIRRTVSGQ